jgi:hypothetical protein
MSEPRLISVGLPELLPQRNRTPGMHVSTIINDLCLRLGHYTADSNRPTNLMEVGSALEHVIAERLMLQFPGRYFRKWDEVNERWDNGIELCRDGIYGTVDLWDLQDMAIEDVKFTKISSRQPITDRKFEKWWWQVKAYCHMSGCRIGRLRVVHINGNYDRSEGIDADVPFWEWEFSEEELVRNWQMLVRHGARMDLGATNGE